MEALLKQARSRLRGREESDRFREGRTPSFTGERNPQDRLKKQLSRQMSYTHSLEEAEYAAAIAAAAFAVSEADPLYTDDRRKPETERRLSLPRIITGLISSAFSAEPDDPTKIYPDEYDDRPTRMVPEKTIHPIPSIRRTPTTPKKRLTFADELADDSDKNSMYGTPRYMEEEWKEVERMKPTSTPSFTRIPSVKKIPSFGEKESEDFPKRKSFSIPSFRKTPTVRKNPSFSEESMEESRRMRPPILPPPIPPPPPAVPPLNIYPVAPPERSQNPRYKENDADAWERDEMAKIKQRYEKLSATILEWEDKKKKKARRKLEMTEREPERRRVKAMHNYHTEMERIKLIADGARAQAQDKQRNEEMKVREKASRYRATGEPPLPPMCLCL